MVVPLREQQATPFAQPLKVFPLPLKTRRQGALPNHQAVWPNAVVEAEWSFMYPAIHSLGLQRHKGVSDAHLIVGAWAVHQHLDLQRPIGQHGVPDRQTP